MSLKLGLVGLPNAGKSTLFNTITGLSVPAENYPFTTIEPNIGVISVLDERVQKIASIINPAKIVFAQIEVRDIAGLVKGASSGEGLGNKFLANIREVDGIIMVLRGFLDNNIQHVLGTVDAKRDREVLESELILKDLDTLTKRVYTLEKEVKKKDPKTLAIHTCFSALLAHLDQGKLAKDFEVNPDEEVQKEYLSLQLLSAKRFIYLLNTDENLNQAEVAAKIGVEPALADSCLSMDVGIENELFASKDYSPEELARDLGVQELKLPSLIKLGFSALGYVVFITAGEKEVRSWPFLKGMTAKQAAGVIHTDFINKFIAVEVATSEDFIALGSKEAVKIAGKLRLEGKDYVIKDGEVVEFRIGA